MLSMQKFEVSCDSHVTCNHLGILACNTTMTIHNDKGWYMEICLMLNTNVYSYAKQKHLEVQGQKEPVAKSSDIT